MKRSTLFAIALVSCGCVHAQFQFPDITPPAAQEPRVSENVVRMVGRFVASSSLSRQKAEFAALSSHCARLEVQFAAGYAARRPELEQQWKSNAQRQAAVTDLMLMMMSQRGGSVSMPDLMNKIQRVMPPDVAGSAARDDKNQPGRIAMDAPPAAAAEPFPEISFFQENANRTAVNEVKNRMEGLSWQRQHQLCVAGLVSGALPKEPGKETAQDSEP